MPWALHERLSMAPFPAVTHMDKWGLESCHGLITLCHRRPSEAVIERVGWWSHIPIPDGKMREPYAIQARDTALSMMNRGLFTILHCNAGRNRSGLIGALVVREIHNWTGDEAMLWVRQCRPRAIDNIYFEEYLHALGRPR